MSSIKTGFKVGVKMHEFSLKEKTSCKFISLQVVVKKRKKKKKERNDIIYPISYLPMEIIAGVGSIRTVEFNITRTVHAARSVTSLVTTVVPLVILPSSSTAIVMESTITQCSHSRVRREGLCALTTDNLHFTTCLVAIIRVNVEAHPRVLAAV
ncbi:hypothetical protein BC941DRAFT_428363 [Chlamydoabsidia padenii]|nr:hypothetical protein BC941DRAFT_428363 [Chlamydoabsidia padenii]